MGKTLIEGVGNYLIVPHARLGNCVIVNIGVDHERVVALRPTSAK